MDDEYGVDDDFLAALAAADSGPSRPTAPRQPVPQKIQQPTPQRLDRAPPADAANASASKIVQPTPQALPTRSSGSSILVSPRQKGNPVLTCLKSVPWEYSDIPADYGLGLTTCALFLSLKYHRLHPEYIYTRIRNLQGKFNLRILLTMVDIPNHEDSLRELSKTSLVNNATVILCWSAAEAARYLELYKSYEHAGFAAIQGHQATGYAEKLVEFVTVPRAINKADAVALVGTFGSLRHAVNAEPEQVSIVGGWGERKVKAWCKVVEEPFRVKKAARRKGVGKRGDGAVPVGASRGRDKGKEAERRVGGGDVSLEEDEELEALFAADAAASSSRQSVAAAAVERGATQASRGGEQLSDGIAAALARLREKG
ncbi:restriction endonuclease type II-like protein [Immersiella caudata]|uniref:Restriction endonuclease type II-like protein n=1 Tax=Immersiella caudata TaxID=314043 RepID=A0AA39WKU5_9PEZI|nr:restriction endonuclease type II-like protein [Immersiella caudata]